MRIAESTEIEILKEEILEDIFEEKYEKQDKDFLNLIDKYTSYKGDDILKEITLKIYLYIQSMPFPEQWLEEKIKEFNIKNTSFEKTIWGEILIKIVKDELEDRNIKIKKSIK
ncbi:MAG: hypothetical protein HFJ54_05830 [Clostridia bacterium]|nr:hypothetical protein [Clostridia bacterium]